MCALSRSKNSSDPTPRGGVGSLGSVGSLVIWEFEGFDPDTQEDHHPPSGVDDLLDLGC